MAGKAHYVLVEKGNITPAQFGFMDPDWAAFAAHCAERNLAGAPKGTKMLCVVTMNAGHWTTDYKLERDFNLMDKVRCYGLMKALKSMGERAR